MNDRQTTLRELIKLGAKMNKPHIVDSAAQKLVEEIMNE